MWHSLFEDYILTEEQMSSDSDNFPYIYLDRLEKKMLLLQQLLTQQNDSHNSTMQTRPIPANQDQVDFGL